MSRIKGNQAKLLKAVVNLIIDHFFMAQFTFSGKTVKGQRKYSFKKKANIIALLYSVASQIDKNYGKDDFDIHLRDKILKYAGE